MAITKTDQYQEQLRDAYELLAALRHTEQTQQALLEALPDAIIRLDFNGTVLDVRGATSHPLRRSAALVSGCNIQDVPFLTEEHRARIAKDTASALESGAIVVSELRMDIEGQGKSCRLEWRIVPMDKKQVLCVVRNLSEDSEIQSTSATPNGMAPAQMSSSGVTSETNGQAQPQTETQPAVLSTKSAPPVSRKRILVVDDNAQVGRSLSFLLSEHEVCVALDGSDALKQMQQGQFDIVLCDLMMPGMNGMDIYRHSQAQGLGYERRFVFMSGGVVSSVIQEFLNSTDIMYLQKPFLSEDLLSVLAKL